MQSLEQQLNLVRLVAAGIAALAILSMVRRSRGGALLSGVSGLHANMLVFMGIGPFAYTYTADTAERVPYPELIAALAPAFPFALGGYALTIGAEWWLSRRNRHIEALQSSGFRVSAVIFFGTLSVVGASLAGSEVSTGGIGTIFPVLRTLLYPSLLMAVISYRPTLLWNSVVGVLAAFIGLTAFFSPWRSGLVMFVVTVSLVAFTGRRKKAWLLAPLLVVAMYAIMPFQIIKRQNFEAFKESGPSETLRTAYELTWTERHEMVLEFISTRTDTAREIAYVQTALDGNVVDRRDGASYWEALQQLIPRTVWWSKPSFGELSGYLFPRAIGLLDWDDTVTSWGVGVWAEFVWNLPYQWLTLFFPLMFGLAGLIDLVIAKAIRQPACIWIAHAAFFFLFLSIVSIVFSMTYIAWLLVVIAVADRTLTFTDQQAKRILESSHKHLALR